MVPALVLLAFGGGVERPPAEYAPTFDGAPVVEAQHGHGHALPLRSPDEPVKAGPDLQLPWRCGGVEYCTQGHNGGSHTGTSAWAWDFAHQEGEEIWAVSAGVVTHLRMNMTTGGCSTDYSGGANYITVDHGDGTSVVYLHMQANSSPLAVGEAVEVGDLVARVGATGYACGAHLHMQVQDTCGSYYCQSVLGNFAGYGDPSASTQYESNNCPECPLLLDGGTTTIDDEDAGCLVRQTTAWWSSYQGHDDHHLWTRAIDAAAPETSARWRFGVSVPGDYRVEVFVPDADADTTNATYLVHHAAGTTPVVVDQSTQKGWQELGVFEFVGNAGEGIELGDDTGEAVGLDRHVAYDAVRFTYEPAAGDTGGETSAGDSGDPDPDGTGGPGGTGDDGPGGTSNGGGATSVGPGGGDGPGDGTGFDETDTRALPPGFGEDESPAGCACRSDGSSPGYAPSGLMVLGLLGWRRRRRRRGVDAATVEVSSRDGRAPRASAPCRS
ncbi:golvesin C-terminal-like domain-containing protein [Paraliomyxa miuraensis]|uniref:golvesin C-terminal-like domain-containing protein n=1 Tax=Paraliomyxa miuraensis TaxID=376150 RepID=UPI002255015A|nr:peptidoglycan DD-metalloendopeptidase family protein [Paraliomyxa miuraensis]MCX4242816.1 peptidoglycan DD-metalloendopeptidase family protein [Paraliomyxa miuraensis]